MLVQGPKSTLLLLKFICWCEEEVDKSTGLHSKAHYFIFRFPLFDILQDESWYVSMYDDEWVCGEITLF